MCVDAARPVVVRGDVVERAGVVGVVDTAAHAHVARITRVRHTPRPPTPTTPPPTTAPPSGPQPCTADQLTVTGVRGGAFQGQEIAGLLFTNTSSTACTMRGYPFAQLRYRGNALGKPAKDDPGTVRTILVRPGKSAQAQLTAVTTCQAPISDHVVEVAPDTNERAQTCRCSCVAVR